MRPRYVITSDLQPQTTNKQESKGCWTCQQLATDRLSHRTSVHRTGSVLLEVDAADEVRRDFLHAEVQGQRKGHLVLQ